MHKKLFLALCVIFFLGAASVVLADSNLGSEVGRQLQAAGEGGGLGIPTDPRIGVARIIRGALTLVGTVLLVLILYAGYMWMTAGGNEEKATDAKKLLRNAVIGLIIIVSAYSITLFAVQLAWRSRTRRDLPAGIYIEPPPGGAPCPYGDEICNRADR